MNSNNLDRHLIVALTREWLGTPYLHQASSKGYGTDCLGLVRGIWSELYGREPEAVPAYTPDWASNGIASDKRDPLKEAARTYLDQFTGEQALPGNVILFRMNRDAPAKHLGIVSQGDKFIHAYAGRAVTESWLSRWWCARIDSLYDFPGVGV